MVTSECRDVTLDAPGMACNLERDELCPLPSTLPPRTSSEPCFVSCSEFSVTCAASCKNRMTASSNHWNDFSVFSSWLCAHDQNTL